MSDILTTTPARARTDAADTGRTTAPRKGITQRQVRRLGLVLSFGAIAWAGSMVAVGSNPTADWAQRFGDITGLMFQIGVFALLTVQLRTSATGLSRKARAMVRVEYVLLFLASVWSLLHAVLPAGQKDMGLVMALDGFWPLSMLGMFVIGVKLAFAGRWKGVLRFWPLVAESWAVVTVPSFLLVGDSLSRWVGSVHLLIGYATLGILLARRPELTGAAE